MLPSWERKITWSVPFTLWVRFANFVSLVCGVQSSLWPLRLFYSLYWIIFIPWSKILLLFSHPVMSICNIMDCSMLGFPILLHLPEFAQLMSIELVMPSNISSFVVPFFSWLQSFPESGSFLISQLFASGRHSIGTSPSASVLPMNQHQDWFPLGLTSLISLQYHRACPYQFSLQWSADSLRRCILCSFVVLAEPTQVCWHRDMASSHTSDANPFIIFTTSNTWPDYLLALT